MKVERPAAPMVEVGEMPRVTICVPAYNASATISETLESLLGQTYRDREIVVSDNHSTDDTREVVAGFAARGVRRVTCPELPSSTGSPLDNCLSGIQNWNSLVALGTGEFLGIYHADDLYDPELLGRQVAALDRRTDSSAVFSSKVAVDSQGRSIDQAAGSSEAPLVDEWFGQADLVKRMLQVGHNVSSSGPLIRRSAWLRAGRFDAETFEQAVDTDFWIRLAGEGPVALLASPMVRYRIHPGQDSARQFGLYRHRPMPFVKVMEHWVSRPDIRARLDARDLDRLASIRSAEYLRVALRLCVDGRPEEARAALGQFPGLARAVALELRGDRRELPRGLARALAAKGLALALKAGMSRQAASVIARRRSDFRDWA